MCVSWNLHLLPPLGQPWFESVIFLALHMFSLVLMQAYLWEVLMYELLQMLRLVFSFLRYLHLTNNRSPHSFCFLSEKALILKRVLSYSTDQVETPFYPKFLWVLPEYLCKIMFMFIDLDLLYHVIQQILRLALEAKRI